LRAVDLLFLLRATMIDAARAGMRRRGWLKALIPHGPGGMSGINLLFPRYAL